MAILFSTLALTFGAVVLSATSASAYTCDSSAGTIADDGICDYINPADYPTYLWDQQDDIQQLQKKVSDLETKHRAEDVEIWVLILVVAVLSVDLHMRMFKRPTQPHDDEPAKSESTTQL